MTANVTQDEKETIITFNEADPVVNVFTYDQRWQRRMAEMGIAPIRTEGQAKEYEFPKKSLRLPAKPRQLTPAEVESRRKSIKLAQLARRTTVSENLNKGD